MGFLDLSQQPLWIAAAVYLAAAAVVWWAGTKAARYADTISRRTGAGGAIVGMVLLGGITSLPEIGTSATAALGGDASLAVSNLLGGVAFQLVVLAIADAFGGRGALTVKIANSSVLMQAMAGILLLGFVVAATMIGDFGVLGVGAWSTGMFIAYIAAVLFVRDQERESEWVPGQPPEELDPAERNEHEPEDERGSVGIQVVGKMAAAGAVILVAGFLLTRSAEAMAGQTGLGANLAGLTLLAIATSLPELSTAISAAKIGRNDLAIGDVFGSNLFDLMLIFFVDVLYAGPPVLTEVGAFAGFAAALGIILTAVYLIGMIERRNRTILRLGYDSLLVLLFYLGGMVLLFRMASG